MKKVLSVLMSCFLLAGAMPFAFTGVATQAASIPQSLKILCIGNSFSCDTIEHVADIALHSGVQNVKLGNLYIGGCSITKHYNNAVNNNASYEYFVNTGSGWSSTYNNTMLSAIESEDWDWISIQHGTADGSRYAEAASYANLPNLIAYIKQHASANTKIAFNMTWVGEKGSHEELIYSFNNETIPYYNAIAALTRDHIVPTQGIDVVSPTGTAIQNARTADLGLLTRDGYHLSLTTGRYIAGLTFFKALTGADISGITWAPGNMNAYTKAAAIEAANNAITTPFSVTASVLEVPPFEWPSNVPYGEAATPKHPYYAHAAKEAPNVANKIDLLPYFNYGNGIPVVQTTMQTANGLGLSLDLKQTPYLYYSFVIPSGSDFTFSIYSNSDYSPWLTFLDVTQGNAKLGQSAESWNALFENNRAQYATVSQTGCIDLRDYSTSELKWVISQMKFYAPKFDSVTVSYFFIGGDATDNRAYRDVENLLPVNNSNVSPADGIADYLFGENGSFTLSRSSQSAIAWPSVRVTLNKTIDLSQTPYLHLNMSTQGGAGNGHLNYTKADGTTGRLQLSMLVKGTNVDFTTNLDTYVDLSAAIGSTGTITLNNYTLSVYGVVDAELTWNTIALAKEAPDSFIAGDLNNNGEIDTADATALLRHLADVKPLDDSLLGIADCNNDTKINTIDVRYILKKLVTA